MQNNTAPSRIAAIDTLRGVAMALMLLDHVREFFFLHHQVSDPMALASTSPALFFSRLLSHFCAPVFVFLTGLGAWCYGAKWQGQGRQETAFYLCKRGLFMVLLEVTLVSFAWSFSLSPKIVYLQVIWAIGLSMLALAVLLWLPWRWQVLVGGLIVAGHHLLDGVAVTMDNALFPVWAMLHERSVFELWSGLTVRTSYPVLPWIGVILLGYAAGPLYQKDHSATTRQQQLGVLGGGALLGFVLLRWLDVYGDKPRESAETLLVQVMSWFNLTKYPPSLLFILLTLGAGLLLLRQFERVAPWPFLATLGRVPLFFYLLHLYALHGVYWVFQAVWGNTQGSRYGVESVWQLWVLAVIALALLYPVCRWFDWLKTQRAAPWMAYF